MFCMSCGNQIPDDAVVCPICGRPQTTQSYQQPYATPVYSQPAPVRPKQKIPGKGQGIASMITGIAGLVEAAYVLLMIVLTDEFIGRSFSRSFDSYVSDVYIEMFTILSFFSFVAPLLAVIFGGVAYSKGFRRGMTTAGIITGVFGMALAVICIITISSYL